MATKLTKFSIVLLSLLTLQKLLWSQTNNLPTHEANTNPLGIRLMRQVPREYIPGSMMEVVLSIYCDAPDPNYPVTAIGLYEMLPSDWTFLSMRGINTDPPPIAPAPGTAGTLQFAWITPPPFPCSFAYTVQISEGANGPKIISGQVEYRTNGPRLVSSPEVTEINGSDKTPPVITLYGDNPLTLTQGTPYVEPGWKAEDNADGDITHRVQTSGTVDVNTPGVYTITYSVKDNAGNNTTTARTVKIIPEQSPTTPPSPSTPTTPTLPAPGPVVLPPTSKPPTPNTPSTVPMPPPKPTTTHPTQGPKPEEVTFPRPDIKLPTPPNQPTSPQESQPKGIASGEPLKPFKIPTQIKSGLSLPPNFQKNQIPTELPPEKKTPLPSKTTTQPENILPATPTTPSIEPQIQPPPSPTTIQVINTSTPTELKSKENTSAIPTLISSTENKKPPLNLISNFFHWWENKSNAEKKNLLGMCVVSLLLTILCAITGATAYQGISPQPRRKKNPPPKNNTK